MTAAARIEDLIAPALRAMGYALVRVKLGGGQRPILQIMIERETAEPNDGGITVDDCAAASRAISAILDVEDPIPQAYSLEVSSPGLDRPLVKAADYDRFKGYAARIELGRPLDGRKRFKGRLKGLAGEAVLIADEETAGGADLALPLNEIASAKLVLTDDLLAAAKRRQQAATT